MSTKSRTTDQRLTIRRCGCAAPGLDKVVKVVFSPTVKHLLAVVSNDAGEGFVRVIDTASGQTILKEKINDEGVSPEYLLDLCEVHKLTQFSRRSLRLRGVVPVCCWL